MRRLFSFFLRSFLQGLFFLAPITITIYLLLQVFYSLDSLLPFMPRGLGFLSILLFVTVIGFIGTKLIVGQYMFKGFDALMRKTPLIKYIYTSIRDIIGSFVGDNKKFNVPVYIKTAADPELWRIGFLTQKDMTYLGMDKMVAVYLPHSYAISGWVVVTSTENIKPVTRMTAAEAMKFAVSGGVTISDESTKDDSKTLA